MKRLWGSLKANIVVELFYLCVRIDVSKTLQMSKMAVIAHKEGKDYVEDWAKGDHDSDETSD
jgi:hypothetical protein